MNAVQEHQFQVHVYFEDTDHFGMVYHPNYIKYMERARCEWLREQGYALDDLYKQGIILAVYSVDIKYLKPAKLNDNLIIKSRVDNIKRTSVVYEHTIYRDEIIICEAAIRVVCLDKYFKPRLFPDIFAF